MMRTLTFLSAMAAAVLVLWLGAVPPLAADKPVGDKPAAKAVDEELQEHLMANAACCVCHIPFIKEELSKTHVQAKINCTKCHGLSAGHANDEDIGATKPDKVYKRDQVDAMCRKCHKEHDVAPADVVKRFVDRKLPADRTANCTDCHGQHRIEKARVEGVPQSS